MLRQWKNKIFEIKKHDLLISKRSTFLQFTNQSLFFFSGRSTSFGTTSFLPSLKWEKRSLLLFWLRSGKVPINIWQNCGNTILPVNINRLYSSWFEKKTSFEKYKRTSDYQVISNNSNKFGRNMKNDGLTYIMIF